MGLRIAIVTDRQELGDELDQRLRAMGYTISACMVCDNSGAPAEAVVRMIREIQPQVTLLSWGLRDLAAQFLASSTTGLLYLITAEDEAYVTPPSPVGPTGTLRLPCPNWDLETQVQSIVYRQQRHQDNEAAATEVSQRLAFEMLLSELSTRFINLPTRDVDQAIESGLQRIAETLSIERMHIAQFNEDDSQLVATHAYTAPEASVLKGRDIIPMASWVAEQIRQQQPIILEDTADLPGEAAQEKDYVRTTGLQSLIMLPLIVDGHTIGVLSAATRQKPGSWRPDLEPRLRLVGDIFAAALARKSSEEALRQSEERYRQFFEMNQVVKLIIDPHTGDIVDANRAATQFYGYSLEELKQQRVFDLNTLPEEQVRQDLLLAASQDRTHFKFRHRLASGEVRDVEIYTGPLNLNGRTFLHTLVFDVTERERLITQEREAQKQIQQQERLAAVGQLAAGIAHDFNNILSVIVLQAEVALSAVDLSPSQRERLGTIVQQAGRASHLVEQVLDFSRRTVLERRPMDLLPFIKEQSRLLERTLPENIRLRLSFWPGEYLVLADPTRLQQAIMNLAINARDAMPEGGELHIVVSRLADGASALCSICAQNMEGDWICLKFTDSGAGIPPNVLPHIFEPFFTTKAPGRGTGLGLAQVYGIVVQHEGHIHVSSSPGKGTTFQIYLSALPAEKPQSLEAGRDTLILGHRETILLAEDDAITRQALEDGLELLNYQVVTAASGDEALNMIERYAGEIDLLLSDAIMPGMGGIALLRHLRQTGHPIPVILISGHPLSEEPEKLRQEGMYAWLPKPASLQQLSRLLAEALHTRKAH